MRFVGHEIVDEDVLLAVGVLIVAQMVIERKASLVLGCLVHWRGVGRNGSSI